MEALFWTALLLVVYTYLGYGILLTAINKMKSNNKPVLWPDTSTHATVSLIVPCFNEGDFIVEKIKNTLELDYPKDKLQIIFVTDGTNDHSLDLIKPYQDQLLWIHEEGRRGKAAAMNRSVAYAQGEILIFCDANTYLNKESIQRLVAPYTHPNVGAVSGEKRIIVKNEDHVSSAGEGLYWKYESWLKRNDSDFYTIVGAAGELMSYRKDLYVELPEDTILDDFIQSMQVAQRGYRVIYRPDAYAMETASANVGEEWKRKVRIAAGGWQSMGRLKSLLNPFNQPRLSFLYLSHRVFRWSIAPLSLLLLILINPILAFQHSGVYSLILIGQILFYTMAWIGYVQDQKGKKVKLAFVAYYFTMMNLAVFAGFKRFLKGSQKAAWERSQRA